MLTLNILSGTQAGSSWAARRFPVRIGRAEAANLRLADDGVWDEHAVIRLQGKQGFFVKAEPNALVYVNAQPVAESHLRNGDVIDLGATRLQFWVGPPRQRGLKFREYLIWAGLVAITLGQIATVYLLLP